jgi:hypothetical protein
MSINQNLSIMKHRIMFLSVFVPFLGIAQQNTVATGGAASGSGGSASYSIGQIDYETFTGPNGSISQGVQQPYEIYTTSINELYAAIEMSLFPNPSSSIIVLTIGEIADNQIMSYNLIDINGKLISSSTIVETTTSISIENLPVANYYLNVMVGEANAKTFKIIKNN